jgi:hypothetical protein
MKRRELLVGLAAGRSQTIDDALTAAQPIRRLRLSLRKP